MSWANCGTDELGRPIGYGFIAECDQPGCNKEIDRGLAYVCGGFHGGGDYGCGKYFCEADLFPIFLKNGASVSVCEDCEKEFEEADNER